METVLTVNASHAMDGPILKVDYFVLPSLKLQMLSQLICMNILTNIVHFLHNSCYSTFLLLLILLLLLFVSSLISYAYFYAVIFLYVMFLLPMIILFSDIQHVCMYVCACTAIVGHWVTRYMVCFFFIPQFNRYAECLYFFCIF